MKAELATRPSKSADEKKQLVAEARKHYEEAQKVFVAAEQRVYERAKALEKEAKTDGKKVAERDEARKGLGATMDGEVFAPLARRGVPTDVPFAAVKDTFEKSWPAAKMEWLEERDDAPKVVIP